MGEYAQKCRSCWLTFFNLTCPFAPTVTRCAHLIESFGSNRFSTSDSIGVQLSVVGNTLENVLVGIDRQSSHFSQGHRHRSTVLRTTESQIGTNRQSTTELVKAMGYRSTNLSPIDHVIRHRATSDAQIHRHRSTMWHTYSPDQYIHRSTKWSSPIHRPRSTKWHIYQINMTSIAEWYT